MTCRTQGAVGLVGLALVIACVGGEPPVEIPSVDLSRAEPEIVEAVKLALAAVRDEPDSARAWGALGDRYVAHGWREEAAASYRRAEQLAPDTFDWPYLLGHAVSMDDLEQARRAFARAVAVDGRYAPARVHLARALVNLNQPDAAREQFEAVLAVEPDHVDALLGLSQLELYAEEAGVALAVLERALALAPDRGDLQHALAQAYLATGDPERARRFADSSTTASSRARMDDPRRVRSVSQAGSRVHNRLGRSFEDQGRLEEALAQYRLVLRNNVDTAAAHINAARVLARLDDQEAAIAAYREALRVSPEYFAALVGLADLLDRGRDRSEAIRLYRQALARRPGNSTVLYRLGTTLAQSGHFDAAVPLLQQALESRSDDAKNHVNLGIALAQLGRLDEAEAALREGLRLDPDDAETHYNLAFLLSTRGDVQGATDHLAEAVRLDPADPQNRQALEAMRRELAEAG